MKCLHVLCLSLSLAAVPSILQAQSEPIDQIGTLAICARATRDTLSPVAAEVLSTIETNPAARADSTVPFSRILSTCNRFMSVRIDGPSIFAGGRDIIALANEEVEIAFYQWDHSSQGAILMGDGLIAAQARRTAADPLYVRIVLDDVDNPFDPTRAINHLYDSQKLWVSRGLNLNLVRLQLATSPRSDWLQANLHDKVIVVDGRYVLVTGAQPQHSFGPFTTARPSGWHDAGFVFEGSAALSAFSAFEHTWLGDAIHWDCRPRDLGNDCVKKSTKYPQPPRGWLPAFGSQSPGNVPLLAVGRDKGGNLDNNTNNPQDVAWLTMMDRATSRIDIETPNINDDAFQSAVVRAIGRGITVRLITSLGFNDELEDAPSMGGDNLEVVGGLRNRIRNSYPGNQTRFQLRWYSSDGIEPIEGNVSRASHTKYMGTDGRIAMVGSGNQDTASWNISREFNFLVDDTATAASIDGALFTPDWNRSVNEYVEVYEGNSGTGDVICAIGVNRNKNLEGFSDPLLGSQYKCDNDEASSILLHDVPAGKVFRFYDDPVRRYQEDDWVEIITNRAVSRKYINTFQQSFSDADVRVIYHRDNGLDGKVSSAEVASSPVGAVMDLYDGNNAGGGLVCSNRITGLRTINLTSDPYCNNDAARSMVLYDFPPDKVIFVYDESGGSRSDDWTLIVPKRTITQATIGSFQGSFENTDVRVCAYPDNGLDGKVSRIRIGDRNEAIGFCGVTANGNPFTYFSESDQLLACHAIAGDTPYNCTGIVDFNDRQMCTAMVNATQTPCTTMTDRNLQLACYGMSIHIPSNCRDITDINMQRFCYGVSYRDPNYCTPITDRNTQLLCFAMSNGIESNCRDISDPDDRNFCYGVSTPSTTYCDAI
jgi:phosphatidylserine/phosphatidylglycerophosphate/cardiolipin synthase-like enzyme